VRNPIVPRSRVDLVDSEANVVVHGDLRLTSPKCKPVRHCRTVSMAYINPRQREPCDTLAVPSAVSSMDLNTLATSGSPSWAQGIKQHPDSDERHKVLCSVYLEKKKRETFHCSLTRTISILFSVIAKLIHPHSCTNTSRPILSYLQYITSLEHYIKQSKAIPVTNCEGPCFL
jgi:hypothetical protein